MRTQSCSSPNTDTESIPSAPMLSATVKDYRAIANQVSAQLAAHGVEQDAKAGSPVEEVSALKQSGLLLLPIPREYGGAGATWPQTYNVVQILSKAQGSVGQLYANHTTLVSMGRLVGGPGQAEQYYRLTAQQNLFWANALNSRDQRLKLMSVNGAFVSMALRASVRGWSLLISASFSPCRRKVTILSCVLCRWTERALPITMTGTRWDNVAPPVAAIRSMMFW